MRLPCFRRAAFPLALALALPVAALAHDVDTLGKIRTAGQINVAYSPDSIPFSATIDGKPGGYSIDLCQGVIAAIGRAVGNPALRVNWIPGTVSERLAAVKAGRADLECANTTTTVSRMADVDFSNLVFVDSAGFLVRTDGPIQSMADFAGKRIGVIAGTTNEKRIAAVLKDRGVEATLVTVHDGPEGTAMLEARTLDVFVGDRVKLVGLLVTAKDPKALSMLLADFSYEPYAFALPRGDSSLRLVVNRELTRVFVTRDIEAIFSRWLGALGRPGSLLSAMYLLSAVPD